MFKIFLPVWIAATLVYAGLSWIGLGEWAFLTTLGLMALCTLLANKYLP